MSHSYLISCDLLPLVVQRRLMPYTAGAFFTTYEGVKSLGNSINSNGSIPAFIVHSTASGAAELVACAILTPAEVIKQNAQMVSSRDTTNSSATRQTLRKFRANPLGLWRGYGALAGRNLPFTAIHFPIFEHFKEGLKDWRRSSVGERRLEQISLLEHAGITSLAAGVAGSIAAVVTTPVDVVKTRIMLAAATGNAEQNVRASGQQATERVKDGKIVDALGKIAGVARASPKGPGSSWRIAREIVQTQGWRGLMRGGGLRAAWTMLGSGLYLGVYDSGRVYLERARKDS